mmetsp:Transcript_29757/g.63181  ORF Transcript_29757/g.63181 Transcript_29757/m.63181 type:complete len:258 (-) Transcript_29757:336-1109(-)
MVAMMMRRARPRSEMPITFTSELAIMVAIAFTTVLIMRITSVLVITPIWRWRRRSPTSRTGTVSSFICTVPVEGSFAEQSITHTSKRRQIERVSEGRPLVIVRRGTIVWVFIVIRRTVTVFRIHHGMTRRISRMMVAMALMVRHCCHCRSGSSMSCRGHLRMSFVAIVVMTAVMIRKVRISIGHGWSGSSAATTSWTTAAVNAGAAVAVVSAGGSTCAAIPAGTSTGASVPASRATIVREAYGRSRTTSSRSDDSGG